MLKSLRELHTSENQPVSVYVSPNVSMFEKTSNFSKKRINQASSPYDNPYQNKNSYY